MWACMRPSEWNPTGNCPALSRRGKCAPTCLRGLLLRGHPRTSWRSSKLAAGSAPRAGCTLQGQRLGVRSLQRHMRQPQFKETYGITYRRTFSLIGRSPYFPNASTLPARTDCVQREAGARRLQSQPRREPGRRKRAGVAMTTFEGAASCCCIIRAPSSPFPHDFSQRLIWSFRLNLIFSCYKIPEINFSVWGVFFSSVKVFCH